jgi:hypothetical protein
MSASSSSGVFFAGTPFILFRTEPSVDLMLINNQPHTGLFHIQVSIQ